MVSNPENQQNVGTNSIRDGRKVGKGEQIYLGHVIDKERGIFKSRKRGLFVYDVETNLFSAVPADFEEPKELYKNN